MCQVVFFIVKNTVFMFANCVCLFDRGPPRFEGDRPRFGDRDGYRGGARGGAPGDYAGEKGGAPAEFQPSFRVRAPVIVLTVNIVSGCD